MLSQVGYEGEGLDPLDVLADRVVTRNSLMDKRGSQAAGSANSRNPRHFDTIEGG